MIEETKKYTEKQQAFLDALMGEARGNVRKAMDIAGYSKGTAASEVTRPLKEEIIEQASMMLAMNAPKAAHGLLGVLDDPTGLVKREKVEVTNNGGGMFILPPKADDVDKQN